MKVLLLIPIISMAAYLVYIYFRYGMTVTISATAKEHRHGWEKAWFMATLVLGVALPVIIYALEITQGNNFQFLWFLAGAGISFVGAAQVYWEGKLQRNVHLAGAYAGIIIGIAACLATLFSWFTVLIVLLFALFTLFAEAIGLKVNNHTYWVEVGALLAIIAVLFFN